MAPILARHPEQVSRHPERSEGSPNVIAQSTTHSKNVTDVTFLRSQPRVQNLNNNSNKVIDLEEKKFRYAKPTGHREERSDVTIPTKERSINNWQMQRQLEALVNKSPNDLRLDELIAKQLGTKFKRASVYDLYPLEIYNSSLGKLDEAKRAEFIDYYDYARKELISVSQGAQLRYLHHDYDLDGNGDYAVIVTRPISYDKKGLARKAKHGERIYLLIANTEQVLYFQPFNADYLELINGGRYPTNLAIGRRLIKIPSPVFRVIALDGDSYVLYHDRDQASWVKIYTDERGDGG